MIRFKHGIFFYLLCFLHFILGINGSVGGILLMLKSDGSILGMEPDWLNDSPFNSYFIPGLLLFIFLGAFSFLTLAGLLRKKNWHMLNKLNIYKDRNWAWTYSLYTGIISIIWITVQQIMTQYFWIQPVITIVGILIIICTLVPEVMKQYEQ